MGLILEAGSKKGKSKFDGWVDHLKVFVYWGKKESCIYIKITRVTSSSTKLARLSESVCTLGKKVRGSGGGAV